MAWAKLPKNLEQRVQQDVSGKEQPVAKEVRANKFGNKITQVGDATFHSGWEAEYYQVELLPRLMAGEIQDLELQKKYEILPGQIYRGKSYRPIHYIADFSYVEVETGEEVVVDTKGVATQHFLDKRKMFFVRYPQIRFETIKKRDYYDKIPAKRSGLHSRDRRSVSRLDAQPDSPTRDPHVRGRKKTR